MRCFLTAVLLVAVLSLIGTNTAQTSSAATIGLNMADGTAEWQDGYVSGTQNGYSTYSGTSPNVVTTPVYAQAYWYNIGAGGQEPIVNLSTTGIRDSSGTLLGAPLLFSLDSNAGTQQVGMDLNGVDYAVGTPGRLGVGAGNGFTITGIPYSSYDVAVMTGYYTTDTAWSLITGNGSLQTITRNGQGSYTGQITGNSFAFTNAPGGDHTVYAVQILNTSVVPEPSTFALCGMGLLVLGCVGLQRKFRQA
jgi:PEP-CTERM motif